MAKPFAQEEELAEKSARLSELNALLNIDRSSAQDSPEKQKKPPQLVRPCWLRWRKRPISRSLSNRSAATMIRIVMHDEREAG